MGGRARVMSLAYDTWSNAIAVVLPYGPKTMQGAAAGSVGVCVPFVIFLLAMFRFMYEEHFSQHHRPQQQQQQQQQMQQMQPLQQQLLPQQQQYGPVVDVYYAVPRQQQHVLQCEFADSRVYQGAY